MAQKRFDMDSKLFDMKTYLNDQIKTKEMDDLIKMDNQLNSEIRSLDGELQTLVYENYHKFISATDIVKSIKNNMNELDVELESLKTSITKINSSYSNVDNKLKLKWKEIRRLDTIEKNLHKLKNLRDLPDAFREAVDKYEENSESINGNILN
jgi:vacuolar protein sorting-associated protein 51